MSIPHTPQAQQDILTDEERGRIGVMGKIFAENEVRAFTERMDERLSGTGDSVEKPMLAKAVEEARKDGSIDKVGGFTALGARYDDLKGPELAARNADLLRDYKKKVLKEMTKIYTDINEKEYREAKKTFGEQGFKEKFDQDYGAAVRQLTDKDARAEAVAMTKQGIDFAIDTAFPGLPKPPEPSAPAAPAAAPGSFGFEGSWGPGNAPASGKPSGITHDAGYTHDPSGPTPPPATIPGLPGTEPAQSTPKPTGKPGGHKR